MIRALVFILAIGITSFIYTDMDSGSIIAIMSLGFWFVVLFQKLGISQGTRVSGGDPGGAGGYDGGGDGDGGG